MTQDESFVTKWLRKKGYNGLPAFTLAGVKTLEQLSVSKYQLEDIKLGRNIKIFVSEP